MRTQKLLFLAACSPLLGSSQLSAQVVWTGGGSAGTPALWSEPGNWQDTIAPANGATVSLTFRNSAANSWSSNDLTGLTVSSISVPANDGAVPPTNIKDNTVVGNAVTLSGNVTISTGNWQSFGFDMALGAVRTFNVTTGQLTLPGTLSGASGGINKSGGGTLILSGSNSLGAAERLNITDWCTVHLDSAAALGAAGGSVRFGNNVGATLSIRANNAINSYNLAGGSSGTGGTVTLGRQTAGAAYSQSFGVGDFGSRTMTFNQGLNVTSGRMTAAIGELRMTAGNNDRPVVLAGNARITVGSASITNNGLAKRLQLDGTDAGNAVTGNITNSSNSVANAVVNVIKANSSTWTLGGANSYTGFTHVLGGTLRLAKRAALYNGDANQWLAAKVGVGSGATLALDLGGAEGFTTSDVDTLLANLSNADINPVSGGPEGFQGGATLLFDTTNVDGGIFTVGEDFLDSTGATGGAIGLTKNGPNTLVLAGNNGYSGPTLINGGRLVTDHLGASVRFAAGAPSAANGVVELTSNAGTGPVDFASGSGNGGVIVLNRSGAGAGLSYQFGLLELSSVTVHVQNGDQVTSGNSSASFEEIMMSGGNDNNPVTIAGDADITIGSASITNNGLSKRLQLDGTSPNNAVSGVISDSNAAIPGAMVNLIKAGASTWHLQGNNTYTGDTTILDGTLKLDHPCLDDGSTVRISGTLELNHNQQDTVASLFINGVEMSPGIYRSASNPGTGTEVPEITGNGTLNVLTGPAADPFTSWAQANITAIDPLADATPGGDPDGDGVENLAEFAFRGDPLSGADQGMIRTFVEDGGDPDSAKELILTLAIRTGNAAPFSGSPLQLASDGVTYTIEGSLDLTTFTAAVTEVSPPVTTGLPDLSGDPSYEYRSFSLDASNGLSGRGFLRAVVED
jgi:autotransporter-associated beta strand protein